MAMELLAARNPLPRTVPSKKFTSMMAANSALPPRTVVGTTLVPVEVWTAMPIEAMGVVGRRLAMAPTLPSLLMGGKPVRSYNSSILRSQTTYVTTSRWQPLHSQVSICFLLERTDWFKVVVLQRLFFQAAKVQLHSDSVTDQLSSVSFALVRQDRS